jgi:hypothetical protein
MLLRPTFLFTTIVASMFITPAMASDPTCRDYTRAKDEDRALFQGYIYGFVVAKIGERGSIEVDTATARVKELADKYCPDHPEDKLIGAIASFAKVVSQFKSSGNAPPNPWKTHQDCEEAALKLTYPRKLNECTETTEACKKLTDDWMSEAVRLKRDCLNKK